MLVLASVLLSIGRSISLRNLNLLAEKKGNIRSTFYINGVFEYFELKFNGTRQFNDLGQPG